MITRSRSLGALLLVLTVACGEPEPSAPSSPSGVATTAQSAAQSAAQEADQQWTRSDRQVGSSVEELEQSVARMVASGLHPQLVAAAKSVETLRKQKWVKLDDWAVRASEVKYFRTWSKPDPRNGGVMPAENFEDPEHAIHVIESIAKDLWAHEIDFLIVPIPNRSQVYPDRYEGIDAVPDDFAGIDLGYAKFVLELARRGVSVVDLLPRFARQRHDRSGADDEFLFHDFDAHWTPRGMEIAAEAIAEAIAELSWFDEVAPDKSVDHSVKLEQAIHDFPDDKELSGIRESVPLWFRGVLDAAGDPVPARSQDSPIVLLGDSFTNNFREHASDVTSHIYARIGVPLDVIAIKEGATRIAWKTLARRPSGMKGKRLVIWLMPSKVFSNPILENVGLFDE